MGTDKAFLRWDNGTLLDSMLKLARSVTADVYIVGGAGKFGSFASTIEDIYRNHGPLGGIHSALHASRSDLNLMVAVDLPFLNAGLLNYLLDRANNSQSIVTVPRTSGGLQPLCAVYRRGFAAVAEEALEKEQNKIDPLFSAVTTCVIEPRELALAGFSEEIFRNVNTPEDLEQAKRASRFGNQP